ncbi:MAG: hypothetical protein ACOY5B_17485 [Spirochaetota bacterium]
MRQLLFFVAVMAFNVRIFSAVVVTSNERIAGTITGKTNTTVTIKMEKGQERTIERTRIVQIFDDNGELVYKSPALSENRPPTNEKNSDATVGAADRTHVGLFLRLLGGGGSYYFSETPVLSNNTGTFTAEGQAGFYSVQIGYSILQNLIVYGARNALSAEAPEYRLNGATNGFRPQGFMNVTGFGAGASYYVPAWNLHFSADVGTALTSLNLGSTTTNSQQGLGINLQVGKEWWIAKNLGLGVSFYFHRSSMDDRASGSIVPKITNTLYGLAVTLTYN